MMRVCLIVLLLLVPHDLHAGAWTRPENGVQQITSAVASQADHSFGSAAPISFVKAAIQTHTEYGLRDWLTLIAASESAYVEITQAGLAPYTAFDQGIEGGARVRLRRGTWGVLSAEASYRAAGAFNFAVSANVAAQGNAARFRLLYGRAYQLGNHDGFIDIAAGRHLLSGPRADETALDVTAGFWFNSSSMVMAQSFNLFAGQGGLAAYAPFASHKLQVTWVGRMSRHFWLQAGGFVAPAGSNTLQERGLLLALWTRF